jgi:hypothetical protein
MPMRGLGSDMTDTEANGPVVEAPGTRICELFVETDQELVDPDE